MTRFINAHTSDIHPAIRVWPALALQSGWSQKRDHLDSKAKANLRASPAVFQMMPPKTVRLYPRFLVFHRNRALIHPESPGHLRPPGVRSETLEERKAGMGSLCRRENTRTRLSRRKSPSPLVALSPPTPPLANPPAGCLHSAVPPPTSLYSAVRRAVCLYSAVGQLLAPRLVDTPGRCSSICLGGHGLGRGGGVEICCSPVARYELVKRSYVGGDELLCVLTQYDY
jgi:hypothetical protein